METIPLYRFDPVDRQQIRLLIGLPAYKRIRAMMDARELALGLVRGRIRCRNPDLTETQLNLQILEATTNVQQTKTRPGAFPRYPSDT